VRTRKRAEMGIRLASDLEGIEESRRAAIRTAWSERWIEVSIAELLATRVASMQSSGLIPNMEASIAKMFVTELRQRISLTAMKTLGMWGQVLGGNAPGHG